MKFPKTTKRRFVLILLGILGFIASSAVVGFLTLFVTWFDMNLCYSDVLDRVSNGSIEVINNGNKNEQENYVQLLKSIPNEGYETNCSKIREILKAHNIKSVYD